MIVISLWLGRLSLPLLMLLTNTSLCYINRLKDLKEVSDYDGADCCTHPNQLLMCPGLLLLIRCCRNTKKKDTNSEVDFLMNDDDESLMNSVLYR